MRLEIDRDHDRHLGEIEMDKRKGFTLIELVVVVMILGILAAVAAPKLLNTSATATDNGAKQTLSVIRDAIERYAADNGGLPQVPVTDLADYLRGPFPACPVGDATSKATVEVVSTDPIGGANASPTHGWKYSTATGEFIINSDAVSASGQGAYDTF
jgi:general secretion pathway protein G